MSTGELITIMLTLTGIGIAIVAALIRTIFAGFKSRMDRLEEKVDRCMEEMIRMAKEGGHG